MSEFLQKPVQITEWSGRALKHYGEWGQSYFDWQKIFRVHREPDRLDMAIWSGQGRLSGLALGLTTGQSLMLRFMEGDPREACPLKGKRILIALEAATNYAQARGKREIRLQPINEKLVNHYTNVYGFVLESPRHEEPYYRKGV
ncbi:MULTISPECIES: hypothetical protein [unclassified Mesorhizobium]|uniref:hypothetical protein n=1 Tax=unclassified Mesorhizobium TaxID=325217 RepID=UPI0012DEA255|nr:hypothetical protein [Mesorhizobium sp. L103C105A0]